MAVEALAWPDPPTLTDGDDNTVYSMGTLCHVLTDVLCRGVQWEVPDSVETPPGGNHVAALWNADTATRLAFTNFTPAVGTLQDITFTPGDEVLMVAGTNYIASVLTEHYTFRAVGPGWTVESPSLNLVADDSRLSASTDPLTMPGGSFDSWFYISPLADEPAVPPSPVPDGLAIPVGLGTPTVGGASTPVPDGLAVPVTLGTPTVDGASNPVPDGLAVPVTLGTPTVDGASNPVPDGLAIPVTLGTPTLGASPHPTGLPIPVSLGTPGVGPTIPNLHLPPMTGTATVVSGLTGGATVLTLTGTATIQ